MSIRRNRERADRLVEEVLAERRARRQHSAQAKAIFLRRLVSPGGLAVCFAAGAVAGLRHGEAEPADADREEARPGNGEQRRFLERFADSPVGNIALRLAAASVVRYLLIPGGHGDGGEAA